MKSEMMQRLVFVLFMLCLCACNDNQIRSKVDLYNTANSNGYEFVSKVNHAKGFTIESKIGYKEITVFNPWKNDLVLRRYALIPRGDSIPASISDSLTVVFVPVRTIALFSNTHVGPIVKLGLENKVVGMTRASKVFNKVLSERVENKQIKNLGGAHNKNIDIEAIVELNPDLIILSAYNEVKSGECQLEEIGLKLAYSINWMEATPLARAEWMKFTAAFFNKEKLADSLFNQMEINYNQLKAKVEKLKKKPNVLLGWSYKGIWYVPGGQNYMVSYLRDAGANYFLFDDDTRGNIPMSVESVLDQCGNATIWIYPGMCKSLNDIENGGEVYTQFDAFKKNKIYNIYKRTNVNGGSDWWERGSVSPAIVLKDFIQILHPDIYPQDSTYFFNRLMRTE